jgi:hypothetical protein
VLGALCGQPLDLHLREKSAFVLVEQLLHSMRFDTALIVYCVSDSLLAAEIFLSHLDRHVYEYKLMRC